MKRSRIVIIIAAVCLCLLLCVLIPALAGSTPAIWIQGHNLKLTDHVSMIYYVGTENLPSGAVPGVAIFRSTKADYTVDTADALLETVGGTEKGFSKFYYEGIADDEMDELIYARPYYRVSDDVTYGSLDSYSVLQYAMEQSGKTGYDKNTSLSEILEWLLEQGGLETIDDYGYIALEGARFADGVASFRCFPVGEEVTLTGLGGTIGWFDETGERVGSNKTLTVTATAEPQFYRAVCEGHVYNETLISAATCVTPATYCRICDCGASNGEPYTVGVVSEHNFDPRTDICTKCGFSNVIYVSNGDGTCRVTGLVSAGEDDRFVIIAEQSFAGETVTSIAANAFSGCSYIEEIVLPVSVQSVGANAFNGVNLNTVFYGGNVAEWDTLTDTYTGTLGDGNNALLFAEPYYYSENEPYATGSFWHWNDDGLAIWPPKQENYGPLIPLG